MRFPPTQLPWYLKPFGDPSLFEELVNNNSPMDIANVCLATNHIIRDGYYYCGSYPVQCTLEDYWDWSATELMWSQNPYLIEKKQQQPESDKPFMVTLKQVQLKSTNDSYELSCSEMSIIWRGDKSRYGWSRSGAPAHYWARNVCWDNDLVHARELVLPDADFPVSCLERINTQMIDPFGEDFWNGDPVAELDYLTRM